jgi:putative FmdB family regulatory protein
MPTYEYECPKCRIKMDRQRPMSESNLPALCPRCGGYADRIMSRIAPQWDKMERLGDSRLLDD